MKQIDKLAWIEIKIKNTQPEALEKTNTIPGGKRRRNRSRGINKRNKELSVDLEANSKFCGS
jgi:hypothetical protein